MLALSAALDAGLSYFDTAPYYGFGLSERRIGDGIRNRAGTVVSTKVGRLLRPLPGQIGPAERDGYYSSLPFESVYDYTYSGIMRSWEASLHRLGLSRIDILFVHDIGVMTHGGQSEVMFGQLTEEGGFRALEELRDAGTIAAFGLGVNEWEVCLRAMEHARLDVLLLAGRYTLLEQGALEAFLPACLHNGVSVVLGGVYNSGILATGTQSGAIAYYNYAPAPPDIVERVKQLESVCSAHAVSMPSAALQFSLAHPAVVSAIIGLRSPAQVAAMIQSYTAEIPAEFWTDLQSSGLLRSDAPVPTANPRRKIAPSK